MSPLQIVLISLLSTLSDLLQEPKVNPNNLSYNKMKLIHHIVRHITPKTAECLGNRTDGRELGLLLQALAIEGGCYGLSSPQDRMLKQVSIW